MQHDLSQQTYNW